MDSGSAFQYSINCINLTLDKRLFIAIDSVKNQAACLVTLV